MKVCSRSFLIVQSLRYKQLLEPLRSLTLRPLFLLSVMLNFIRSLVTKSKSANTSPATEHVSSFSPPRRRRPIVAEQEVEDLDEVVGHYGTVAPDSGNVNNTGSQRILEPRVYREERPQEQAQRRTVDAAEKEVAKGHHQQKHIPVRPGVVGLGIVGLDNSPEHGKPFDAMIILPTENDAHDGLHERLYAEYEERVQQFREVERQLAALTARNHDQTRELEEEAQDLRSEVRRLRSVVWG